MSLLNLTNDGLPNVLIVLYAVIARSTKPLSRDELLERVAPAGVADEKGKMARQTLNRWCELGLFDEISDGIVLKKSPESGLEDEAVLLREVRKAARNCALSDANNKDLWASVDSRSADLTRSLAWLLAQDVYRTSFVELEALELKQIPDASARLMQNDTRRNGLRFWGHFLGFVRQPGGGDIDPTIAIRETLPDVLEPEGGMPAAEFVEALAERLPVLDGGAWRRSVEQRLDSRALPTLADGQLSTALSRALISLMLGQELDFENRADVGRSVIFSGRDGVRTDYRYSWVRRAAGANS